MTEPEPDMGDFEDAADELEDLDTEAPAGEEPEGALPTEPPAREKG